MKHRVQGGPEKNDTIILQLYVTESCGFRQNVQKELRGRKVELCVKLKAAQRIGQHVVVRRPKYHGGQ